MSGRHLQGEPTGETWPDEWLTPDEARAVRADERSREIGAAPVRMPMAAYVAMARARDRAAYLEIIRTNRRVRLRRALWWLAVLAALALGIAGLMLTAPIPGIG